jgi:flavorubredoxin
MKPVELKKGIYWVGAIDWDLRNFHGYLTPVTDKLKWTENNK